LLRVMLPKCEYGTIRLNVWKKDEAKAQNLHTHKKKKKIIKDNQIKAFL